MSADPSPGASIRCLCEQHGVVLTPFQRRVYEALLEVPRGRVTTYGLLAARIGCRSAQAVGGALRKNPFAPQVPCHRVVASDFSIGGFCGSRGGGQIRRKLALLKAEGVCFDRNGRLSEPGRASVPQSGADDLRIHDGPAWPMAPSASTSSAVRTGTPALQDSYSYSVSEPSVTVPSRARAETRRQQS